AHAIVPEVEALVGSDPGREAQRALDLRRNGAESEAVSARMVRAAWPLLTDVDARLAAMDAAGIDVQVVSPSPSQYHYWAGPALAEEIAATANRGIAALVARAPARLSGLGLVSLQHPELAVRQVQDAIELGLVGVEISSHAP